MHKMYPQGWNKLCGISCSGTSCWYVSFNEVITKGISIIITIIRCLIIPFHIVCYIRGILPVGGILYSNFRTSFLWVSGLAIINYTIFNIINIEYIISNIITVIIIWLTKHILIKWNVVLYKCNIWLDISVMLAKIVIYLYNI